ncbi:MAG: acetyl-CoA carboxylase biotin carboxylase subunit, partial [Rhizobiaceae bacterium]|nr:acetyl-CoA carboxylase biotin carboxylase subunit [Rhizobiaceae bacterium]
MKKRSTTINSILIANRGEIAVRIIKTAKAMGIGTIAVYSDVDQDARHVKEADDAFLIGPAPATQSYLSIDNVIAAAQKSGADAIHPGYGFLSENAAFARACDDAGIIFIGPSPQAMEIMGNKAAAKARMIENKIGCVPGYNGKEQSDEVFASAAQDIGYPLMVKAANGGGGRGMRLVENSGDLATALEQARGEALSAFGSGELILEKLVTRAHHIEFQILGDMHGNIIHLGERDCSLQRRHQKVIEEAPSPAIDEALRAEMGKVAVAAARSVSYEGAGTVEFLLDEGGDYYFLEMNTRLQVEHPVTEMITGIDLVEWQIRIARGEVLSLTQDDVTISGHAIEARFYAEDPEKNFMPSTGKIESWIEPAAENIRVDSGIVSGDEITPHYDAMVAKIIAHGPTREDARLSLARALDRTTLFGINHNKAFLGELLGREEFIAGSATTALIDQAYGEENYSSPSPTAQAACLA